MATRTNQIQGTRITAVEFCAQYMPFQYIISLIIYLKIYT